MTGIMTRPTLSSHSRFGQRVRRRYEGQLHLLPQGLPNPTTLSQVFATLREQGLDTGAALRVTRQLVLERLLTLDCDARAPLDQITRAMTDLAEFALNTAWGEVQLALDESHGIPQTHDGQRAQLWIVGMGKLGARELNVSSDIDLIYVYDDNGDTTGNAQGRGRISNHEYFGKVVKAIYSLVGDTTEHGFVFRVDLALRPNGNSGPAAISLDGLENYLHVQGREWERFAWLKSRVVAPLVHVADGAAQPLRNVVIPFVFRRYLDYNVFDALRILHQQIRDHAGKRSAGRPERANDVKLSRGGIREIEFTVQLLQVVRGGQFPELRTRPTVSALTRLVKAGLMPEPTAHALAEAYVFLRQIEHRIQYLDDQQTHVLPTDDQDLAWIANTLGFDTLQPFLQQLDAHREVVAQEFDKLLGGGADKGCHGCKSDKAEVTDLTLEELAEQLPGTFRTRVIEWQDNPRILALRDESRTRLIRLIARTAQWLADGKVTEAAAVRLADWMEPLLRRESYLALLLERPNVHERLLRLLGAARWPARYLLMHPGVIDELANASMLNERFSAADFEHELEHRRASLSGTGEDDEESLLNLLRRAHHAEVFRTLARDVEGKLSVEAVADDLSSLAETILRLTTRWCWER
nr:bifunctional [glutamate--ammonia ligase]-adenylyl-L-tyrosine phosphorylase/[glutamate--ammonia-ligase] adenylyltransferase [Rhodoferax sp.]